MLTSSALAAVVALAVVIPLVALRRGTPTPTAVIAAMTPAEKAKVRTQADRVVCDVKVTSAAYALARAGTTTATRGALIVTQVEHKYEDTTLLWGEILKLESSERSDRAKGMSWKEVGKAGTAAAKQFCRSAIPSLTPATSTRSSQPSSTATTLASPSKTSHDVYVPVFKSGESVKALEALLSRSGLKWKVTKPTRECFWEYPDTDVYETSPRPTTIVKRGSTVIIQPCGGIAAPSTTTTAPPSALVTPPPPVTAATATLAQDLAQWLTTGTSFTYTMQVDPRNGDWVRWYAATAGTKTPAQGWATGVAHETPQEGRWTVFAHGGAAAICSSASVPATVRSSLGISCQ